MSPSTSTASNIESDSYLGSSLSYGAKMGIGFCLRTFGAGAIVIILNILIMKGILFEAI